MFERFTDRSRRAVVMAQEHARVLGHAHIGTEHLLLGLAEVDGLAAAALAESGLTVPVITQSVIAETGKGASPPTGHIPFTTAAKKVLEHSLREALSTGCAYIGTEHLLLGLLRQEDSTALTVIRQVQPDLEVIRRAVRQLVAERRPESAEATGPPLRRLLTGRRTGPPLRLGEPETSPATGRLLSTATELAAGEPVGSHHVLQALLAERNSAAARLLADAGVDLDGLAAQLAAPDLAGTTDEDIAAAGARQLTVTLTGDRVVVEARDAYLLEVAHRVRAGAAEDEAVVLRGNGPYRELWSALAHVLDVDRGTADR